jgi:hypothetical protein
MPSSLSALAGEATAISRNISASDVQEIQDAGLQWDVSCRLAHAGGMASGTAWPRPATG